MPLEFPIRTRIIEGVPRLIAGGVPVIPINLVLRQRQRDEGATLASLETYTRAAQLYVEFCAHRHQSLLGITNEEFLWFKRALLGDPFLDALGNQAFLRGKRGRRTADLMLALLYSIAADIADRYNVAFDWRRYKGVPDYLKKDFYDYSSPPRSKSSGLRRTHRLKWVAPKILGLPDAQFIRLLQGAYDLWGQVITDGDRAFAANPEKQRGALFYRNVALLTTLRWTGSRRSEVVQLRLSDIDQATSLIYLTTKGHRTEGQELLPVLLIPWVYNVLWHYAIHYRPLAADCSPENQQAIFVSHSPRNYGTCISDESVRAVLTTLRDTLDPPWKTQLTPHMLRHSYGYDLQKLSGPAAITTNMRHASILSSEPYAAGPETFADELIIPSSAKIENLFSQAGLMEMFHDYTSTHY